MITNAFEEYHTNSMSIDNDDESKIVGIYVAFENISNVMDEW